MNRDTLYRPWAYQHLRGCDYHLDQMPGKRYMSLMIINNNGYVKQCLLRVAARTSWTNKLSLIHPIVRRDYSHFKPTHEQKLISP